MNELTVANVREIAGEPRILDLDVADRLGFGRSRDIRKLIRRYRLRFERFGEIRVTLGLPSSARGEFRSNLERNSDARGGFRYNLERNPDARGGFRDNLARNSRRRGRPTTEYWLNEYQTVLLCVLSRADKAAAVQDEVVRVFVDARHERLMARSVPGTDDIRLLAVMARWPRDLQRAINRDAWREGGPRNFHCMRLQRVRQLVAETDGNR